VLDVTSNTLALPGRDKSSIQRMVRITVTVASVKLEEQCIIIRVVIIIMIIIMMIIMIVGQFAAAPRHRGTGRTDDDT
jgi:amino acid permease